jgi:hypothetical protein
MGAVAQEHNVRGEQRRKVSLSVAAEQRQQSQTPQGRASE